MIISPFPYDNAQKEREAIDMNEKFGYARVSSKDQNLDRQLAALKEKHICHKKIYIDKMTGKNFERPGYQRMLRKIGHGDELYIKSIDRLGRNYEEIIEQWRFITKTKNADIIVLDFPLLDTRLSHNGLTGKFVADITLQIMSYVAQLERENIHQRQAEGIREAKNRGVRFGRPKREKPNGYEEVFTRCRNGDLSLRQGAKLLGVSHTMLTKWMKEQESTENTPENCKK